MYLYILDNIIQNDRVYFLFLCINVRTEHMDVYQNRELRERVDTNTRSKQ